MMRGCRSLGSCLRMRRVASSPSSSGICMSINTTSYSWRSNASMASSPLPATSARYPRRSRIRNATFWLITLSSASRIRSGRRCPIWGSICARCLSSAGRCDSLAKITDNASNNWEGLIGLVSMAAKSTLSALISSRPPSEVNMTNGISLWLSRIAPASSRPVMPGICMSSTTASNCSPSCTHSSASCGELVSLNFMPHLLTWLVRIRRLVSLSSTISSCLPLRAGCSVWRKARLGAGAGLARTVK